MTKKIIANAKSVRKSRDQLVDDLKRVVEDFQDLTEESKNASGAAIQRGFHAVQEDFTEGVHFMHDIGNKIAAGAERCTDSVGESISKHPWRAITIAAVAGLILDRFLPRAR